MKINSQFAALRAEHFLFSEIAVLSHAASSDQMGWRKHEKQPVPWCLKNDVTALLSYLVLFSCLSLPPNRKTQVQLTCQSKTIISKGICAFTGTQGPHLQKHCCILSSCLAVQLMCAHDGQVVEPVFWSSHRISVCLRLFLQTVWFVSFPVLI